MVRKRNREIDATKQLKQKKDGKDLDSWRDERKYCMRNSQRKHITVQ